MQVLKQYMDDYIARKITAEDGLRTPFSEIFYGAIAYACTRETLNKYGADILQRVFERADKLRKIDAVIALCEDRRKLRTLYRLRMRLQLETEKVRERH